MLFLLYIVFKATFPEIFGGLNLNSVGKCVAEVIQPAELWDRITSFDLVGNYRSEVKARQDVKPDICQAAYTDYRQPPVDYRHPPVADYRQPPTLEYRHPPALIDYRQHSIADYRPQVKLLILLHKNST